MTVNQNPMREAFNAVTQGRTASREERLMFEAGFMAGQKDMQERCAALMGLVKPINFTLGESHGR